ncbi:MAG TPA: response regulator [Thermoanaerobaculia bacterium]|nr:response regulator [Thermoanaerobaculia bacterium]
MSLPPGFKVLLVDDNPLVLKLGRAIVEREGLSAFTASTWIDLNRELASQRPDLILMDINMPVMKGNRLSELLKSKPSLSGVPIVLMSDLPEDSLQQMFASSGADAWIRKPLTRDKIVSLVTKFSAA